MRSTNGEFMPAYHCIQRLEQDKDNKSRQLVVEFYPLGMHF